MFNAYTHSSAMPGYNARFTDLQVDNFFLPPSQTQVVSFLQEGGAASDITLKFSVLGEVVTCFIPQLTSPSTTVSRPTKVSAALPAALRPVDDQFQVIKTACDAGSGPANTVGVCGIASTGVITIACLSTLASPTTGTAPISYPFVLTYRLA